LINGWNLDVELELSEASPTKLNQLLSNS